MGIGSSVSGSAISPYRRDSVTRLRYKLKVLQKARASSRAASGLPS